LANLYTCISYVPFASNPLELEVYPLAFLFYAYNHGLLHYQSAVNCYTQSHLFHVDISTCEMQAMVDMYKDIPHNVPEQYRWHCPMQHA
jgi:hypothetical protein